LAQRKFIQEELLHFADIVAGYNYNPRLEVINIEGVVHRKHSSILKTKLKK
jgi:hypothetical protein